MTTNTTIRQESPGSVAGYEKELDRENELHYVKRHENGATTNVNVSAVTTGWQACAVDVATIDDSTEDVARCDLLVWDTRSEAAERILEFMENHPYGVAIGGGSPLNNRTAADLLAGIHTGEATFYHQHIELSDYVPGHGVWTVRPAGGEIVEAINPSAYRTVTEFIDALDALAATHALPEVDTADE